MRIGGDDGEGGDIGWAAEQLRVSERTIKDLVRKRQLGYIALTPGARNSDYRERHGVLARDSP